MKTVTAIETFDVQKQRGILEAEMWKLIKALANESYKHPSDQLRDAIRVGKLAEASQALWIASESALDLVTDNEFGTTKAKAM